MNENSSHLGFIVTHEKVISADVFIERQLLTELSSNNIANSSDYCIEFPSEIGTGISYGLDLDKETKLILTEVEFSQVVNFDSEKNSMCGVFILLEGELMLTISGQEAVTVNKDTMVIFFLGDSECRCRYSAKKTKMINFSITSDLMALLAQQSQVSPIRQSSNGNWILENDLWTMPIIPEISTAIKQIYTSKLQGAANKVYLQAKVIEILSLAFHWYQHQNTQFYGLSRTDFDRILNAAKIIESKMKEPPSLLELARLVGINDNKLKKQFKQVFNQAVFEYLSQKRLEKAEHYFIHSEYNVKQVACEIGLKHLGYFSAQFKKNYALSPHQYIKKHRTFSH